MMTQSVLSVFSSERDLSIQFIVVRVIYDIC